MQEYLNWKLKKGNANELAAQTNNAINNNRLFDWCVRLQVAILVSSNINNYISKLNDTNIKRKKIVC